jgi:hypothetical protein
MQINPVKYRYKTDEADSPLRYGWTAQNLQPAIPEAVINSVLESVDGGPQMLTVIPDYILPVLLQAVKELSAKVADLEARLP